MKRNLIALLLFFALPLGAAETGYRIVHPDGTVEFTDDPTRGGEKIPLRKAPTIKSTPLPPAGDAKSNGKTDDEKGASAEPVAYQSMAIVSPESEQTLWFDGSSIQVTVMVAPRLASGHSVVILLDGNEVVRGEQTSFSLPQLFRGSHTLKARIEDATGNTLLQADPVTFYMRRHTVN
ncbi:MAG: DUF4124 domain-containing protein [Gammaproteobacteria bacterium]|nr:DUF4124 domain-containing protein [Gammaproteobacteria bacterium]MCW8840036.1 DUF4124 domain-containing protein [Gammaproteobacteria bacterium]MCW8927341.1 DUF4124 domain-containing protein [Gammaproteobacteria bacterium]MCW8959425.1 DUF4124 domain-containing protein [Gammaproteobacteria bacterium]MCW8971963.1 DUF4124 domain-containing protein [Gammaproteobacteria bacterium]